ncbi:IS3 family element, transposase orfB [Klebsiella variicola]|nr:IS3 family element, transposase orfB [Klebsiella variicola]
MSDNLFNGRRFRALTVVDNFSRECVAIHAGKSLKGEDVVGVMEGLRVPGKRLPVRIQTDNGSEFISKSLDKWAYEHGVTMDFSRPGKPTDNPFMYGSTTYCNFYSHVKYSPLASLVRVIYVAFCCYTAPDIQPFFD